MVVSLDAARGFVGREGRVLEQRVLATVVDGARPDGAVDALMAYRNGDGGFGHGLEPDALCPDSLPIDDQLALEVMDGLGGLVPEVALGICDHLSTLSVDGAVPLATPAIERHPRAEHMAPWTYEPSLNPTAGIVGLLHAHGVQHPWVEAATAWCWEALADGVPPEGHVLLNVLTFLGSADDDRVGALVAAVPSVLAEADHVRLDPDDAAYGVTPLHYAPTPDSRWRSLFDDELIDAHLDRLEREQADDGGWVIGWEPPSTAATLAYRGIETVRAVRVLLAHGRLDAA